MSKRVFFLIVGLISAAAVLPLGRHGRALWSAPAPQAFAGGSQSQEVRVEQVTIRGNRRIPESTIKIWISTREGDPYDPSTLDRDVRALYAQGHFQDVKVFSEDGTRGGKIVTFEVKEWPLILEIKYEGLKSVQQSKILEEYRKRQIGLSKESQYDPVKARRAAAVVKDLLADEGHPDAQVRVETENISATAVSLIFKIDEGPRVRVADIQFEGNKIFSNSFLRSHMKYVKQVGLLTTFSSKDIYHKEKLATDLDRLRVLVYAEHGYLRAQFGQPRVEEVGEVGTWVPIFGHKGRGIKLIIPVTEGRQYTAGEVKIEDNAEFTAEDIKTVIGIKPGEIVRGPTINKGIENLKKLYGSRGYIQFSADVNPEWHDSPEDPGKGVADLTFSMQEGKQFTLRRLEFIGNTFTRDYVMRREVLLNEGERYNQNLWELSLLRLNQLGYFEQIKPEDATVNTNEREGQVDLTLKVQEKGRQQISFTGGVSGIGGSFVGINYSTNNLLGFGEALSAAFSVGNRQKVISFGFTEPYFRGRPISIGFNVFYQDLQFLGQGFGTVSSTTLLSAFDSSALFTQRTKGGSVNLSAPLSYFAKRFRMGRFVRLGMSYSFTTTDVLDPSNPTANQQATAQVANALFIPIPLTFHQNGVTQSTLTPSFSYNTLNNSLDPTSGKSFSVATALSGTFLGGKVNTVEPTVEFKMFKPLFAGRENTQRNEPGKTRAFGFRIAFAHIGLLGTPFQSNSLSFIGGMPLFSRFYLGGEESIRGYDIRSIAPLVALENSFTTQNVFATDLTGTTLKVRPPRRATVNSVAPDVLQRFTVTREPVALFPGQIEEQVPLGGDSQLLFNAEYRIPIIGPVAVVPFFDIGSAFNLTRLSDQFITSDFQSGSTLNGGTAVTLNPRGEIATPREIAQARTPETPPGALPPGFKLAFIKGDQSTTENIALSKAAGSFLDNYRYSLGTEIRVQVPVINVPFRLIFALNPNARVNNPFVLERKHTIRFSVGRTF
jgi:outer membrane protein insertion porin family